MTTGDGDSTRIIDLGIVPVTPDGFARFGTLIEATHDGKMFGPDEAQLELARGTPRFYIMRLEPRPSSFRVITRHRQVTQCLASAGAREWLLAVAPPDRPDATHAEPDPGTIRAFRIPAGVAIMLHRGTWHAGPFFEGESMDFFNLELADTNQTDHHSCRLDQRFGLEFRFQLQQGVEKGGATPPFKSPKSGPSKNPSL